MKVWLVIFWLTVGPEGPEAKMATTLVDSMAECIMMGRVADEMGALAACVPAIVERKV